LVLVAVFTTSLGAAEPGPRTLLVLPFEMVDTSLQGEMNHGPLAADVARLQRTEQVVRRALAARDEFDLVEREPIAAQIEYAQQSYRYLYACNGCEIDLGQAAGAELVLTGWVQKVSNLIININATLYDVERGEAIGGASVDMRGNTDSTWRAAALYLVNHSLPANYHSRQHAEAQQSPPP
jgi:hypothetical protein